MQHNTTTTQVYQRRNQDQDITPFLDKHLILEEEEESEEHDLCNYDLRIDIEQELHKVMQNVPLSELVKLPSIKDQVQQFFDSIQQQMFRKLFMSLAIFRVLEVKR